jgi:hypothetical protein
VNRRNRLKKQNGTAEEICHVEGTRDGTDGTSWIRGIRWKRRWRG